MKQHSHHSQSSQNNTHTTHKVHKTTLTPLTKLTKQQSHQNTLNTPFSTLTIQITTLWKHPQYPENRTEVLQEIEIEGRGEENGNKVKNCVASWRRRFKERHRFQKRRRRGGGENKSLARRGEEKDTGRSHPLRFITTCDKNLLPYIISHR
jgi:hypothetical protein